MGFCKLDDQFVFSSLMREGANVVLVWVVLMSLTRADGIARVSPAFLEAICRDGDGRPLALDEIERCLKVLQEPDRLSRTKEHDGRRIEPVDGGYLLINYEKYRALDYRESERIRKRESRRKTPETPKCPDTLDNCPDTYASASRMPLQSSSEASNEKRKNSRSGKKGKPDKKPPVDPLKGLPDNLREAVKGWIESRKKKPTARAIELALKKAEKMHPGDVTTQAEVFDRSTMSGWSDLYPIDDQQQGNANTGQGRAGQSQAEIDKERGIIGLPQSFVDEGRPPKAASDA